MQEIAANLHAMPIDCANPGRLSLMVQEFASFAKLHLKSVIIETMLCAGALVGAERAGLLGRHAGARSARHLLSRAQERQNRTRTRPRRVRCQWSEPPHFRHLGRMSVLALIPISPRYVGNRRSVPNSDIETTLNLTLQYPRIFGATVA
jgi:hypothetical protein